MVSFKKNLIFRKKSKIIIFLVTTLFIAGAVIGWLFTSNQDVNKTPIKSNDEIARSLEKSLDLAEKALNKGGKEDASRAYDSEIAKTEDKYSKAFLLTSKATIFFNDADYDEALKIAKEAEQIYADDTNAYFIAQIYEKTGDKGASIEYYKKAIALIDENDPLADADSEYYASKIKLLGGE